MTQPARIPVIATEPDPYDAPGKDWNGADRTTEMDEAAVADGFEPDQPFTAQDANWLFNNYGRHFEALASLAVDNWSDERRIVGAELYRTHAQNGRMFGATAGRLGFSMTSAGAAPFSYAAASDLATWTAAGVSGLGGFTDWSPCYSNGTIVLTVRESTGEVFQTSNLGSTWTGAGTGVGVNTHRLGMYSAVASLWIILGASGGDNAAYVDANLSGAWTYVAPHASVLADTNVPRDIQENSSEVLIAYSNGVVARSTNGTTWTVATLPSFTDDVVGIAWSASHSLWICVGTTGKTWLSANGTAWVVSNTYAGTYTAGGRVAALGRYWLVGAAGAAPGILRLDHEAGTLLPEYLGSISGPSDMFYHVGSRRVVAALAAADDIFYKLSLRLGVS